MKKIILIVVIFISIGEIYAQVDEFQNFKTWMSLSVSKKINENLKLSYAQLQSFSANPFELSFVQPKLKIAYKLKSRTYIQGAINLC